MGKKSANKDVQVFLDKTLMDDYNKFQIIDELRNLIFTHFENAKERFMYGGIMLFSDEQDFGGLFAYTKHISFEFSAGVDFEDPDHILEGNGKFRRHVKLMSMEDIARKQINNFLKQAVSLI